MTIEVQCASCSHRSVCSKMDEYKDMVNRLAEVLGEFSEDLCKVEIKCRHYDMDKRTRLSNTLASQNLNVLSEFYYEEESNGQSR